MLTPGTILQNRYCIVRQLGQGGMGTVYEATDQRLRNKVALKETLFTDEPLRKQFEREAELLARLHHPALPVVIDHFPEEEGQFLVMQYIDGEDFGEMLQHKNEAFPLDHVLDWGDQLLDALDYLHTQETPIIHRDIKPQNLKLTSRRQIILLDFGLAKGFAGVMSRVTTSGSIFGFTPNYAPIEQVQGSGTDPRSDLYSLAATLYHLITKMPPPDVLTRLAAISDGEPDPMRPASEVNSKVSINVAAVLDKAMAIGRNRRPGTAAEMRAALRDARQSEIFSSVNQGEPKIMPQTFSSPPPTQLPSYQVDPTVAPTLASPPSNRSALWYKIRARLNTSYIDTRHITIYEDGGTVVIAGTVPDITQKTKVEHVLRSIRDIKSFRNNLRVSS
jgi:serine/threonine protein kinase